LTEKGLKQKGLMEKGLMEIGLIGKIFKKKEDFEFENIGVITDKPKLTYQIVDEYFIKEPYSKINIFRSEELGEGLFYYSIEDPLNDVETEKYQKIMKLLSKELEPPTEEGISPVKYVYDQAKNIVLKYERSLGKYDKKAGIKFFIMLFGISRVMVHLML